jgi:hypothetical protein
MKTLILGLLAASTVAIALPAAAQSVDAREHRQEARIQAGERTGQLTPRETYRLQRQEGSIRRQEHRMRTRDYGHLTWHDHRVLEHRLNRESRHIHRLRHNARFG